jgi:hypothetical protein
MDTLYHGRRHRDLRGNRVSALIPAGFGVRMIFAVQTLAQLKDISA